MGVGLELGGTVVVLDDGGGDGVVVDDGGAGVVVGELSVANKRFD